MYNKWRGIGTGTREPVTVWCDSNRRTEQNRSPNTRQHYVCFQTTVNGHPRTELNDENLRRMVGDTLSRTRLDDLLLSIYRLKGVTGSGFDWLSRRIGWSSTCVCVLTSVDLLVFWWVDWGWGLTVVCLIFYLCNNNKIKCCKTPVKQYVVLDLIYSFLHEIIISPF